MPETLGAFLDEVTARMPDGEAIAYAPRNEVTARISWAALRHASRTAAKKLVDLGVSKGSRVALLCSNRPEWLPIAFGVLRLGAILVPLSTLWKRDELEYGLQHADVATLLMIPGFLRHDYVATLNQIVPELRASRTRPLLAKSLPMLRQVVLLEGKAPGAQRWNELSEAVDDDFLAAMEETVSPFDWATIFFTSGTTAQAKAVLHRHAALATSARRVGACMGITPGDSWWGHMPLFWSGGFILGALATMAGGGRIVLHETVDAAGALELLEREGCTVMAGWHQAGPLLEHPDFPRRKLRLKKGTNHPLATRLLGPDHCTIGVYGMSETATCVTAARWDDPEPVRTGTFGRPLEGMEVRIIDPESRRALGVGESGEIHVKGPTLMESYYKVDRAAVFGAEGFFKTGDLGYFDERGYLHFATRLKDVIKTAGVNVASVEVEEVLARHPSVKSAHVVGVTHPTRGENVAAFVIARPGSTPSAADLREFCKQSLASYKVPRHVFLIAEEELPRTASGKVEKVALRRQAEVRLGSEAAE
jgi:fatty-acyl-CoA synthase